MSSPSSWFGALYKKRLLGLREVDRRKFRTFFYVLYVSPCRSGSLCKMLLDLTITCDLSGWKNQEQMQPYRAENEEY